MPSVRRDRDPLATLIERVSALGFPRAYVQAQIPSWWSPTAGNSKSALMQAELTVARRLGLDIRSLLEGRPTLAQRLKAKYKRARRYSASEVAPSTAICIALAEAVAANFPLRYEGVPKDPQEIRAFLFNRGAKRISLSALVMYCWHIGVPVVHASRLPAGLAKVDGLVVSTSSRPVIVLAKQSRFQAWLLFILAHELGHIARGHVNPGEFLIDEDFEGIKAEAEAADPEEVEANEFALEILNGSAKPSYEVDLTSAPVPLARRAMELSKIDRVDPGHILLVQARKTGQWAEANAALREFQETSDDARKRINKALAEQLNAQMSDAPPSSREELSEFTALVTGQAIA
jgi:hypothetical protein